MLVIKLAKTGKTNKKMFRLIISEKSRDPYGRVLEILGSYNPHSKELTAKDKRIKYWLSKGAKTTATINNLLVEKKIIAGKKVVASKTGKNSKKKMAKMKDKNKKKTTKKSAPANEKPAETPNETSKEPLVKNTETSLEKSAEKEKLTKTENSPKEPLKKD